MPIKLATKAKQTAPCLIPRDRRCCDDAADIVIVEMKIASDSCSCWCSAARCCVLWEEKESQSFEGARSDIPYLFPPAPHESEWLKESCFESNTVFALMRLHMQ
jgi:hypothetical protein